jgi:hypothetical protein
MSPNAKVLLRANHDKVAASASEPPTRQIPCQQQRWLDDVVAMTRRFTAVLFPRQSGNLP